MADEHLDQAIATINSAGTTERVAVAGEHFSDPVVDAYSVAAASVGQHVRAPDPRVEQNLPPGDAVAAASGLLTRRLLRTGRWWEELPGPVVAGQGEEAVAVVPVGGGAVAVHRRRAGRVSRASTIPEPAEVITPALPDLDWWRLIVWSLRRQRRTGAVLLALSVVAGLAGLLLPLTTAALFSYALPIGSIVTVGAIIAAFALGSTGAAAVLLSRNLNVLRMRDVSDSMLSTGAMARTLRVAVPYFRRTPAGDTLNRLLTVEQARAIVDDGVPALILTSVFGIASLLVLIVISPPLALGVALVVGVVIAATLYAQIRARRSLATLLQKRSESDTAFMAVVDSLTSIRVAGAERRALEQWSRTQAATLNALARRLSRLNAQAPLLAAGPLLVTLVLVLADVQFGDSVLPLASFMTAYAAVVQLTLAMTVLSQNLVLLWELGPAYERLAPLTAEPLERTAMALAPGPLKGRFTLTDVVFGYEQDRAPLFDGLSLHVDPGEFVAVVGPSGSGKSTLLRLMLGFESPWGGVVNVDDSDLAELDVSAVRRQIGTVLQSSLPFGSSIRDCVCGPLSLSDDELWQVLADCGLADAVAAMPDGLDAPLEQHGSSLSGGQRQRLMIARALAGQPKALLFDEATSALDIITQGIVMQKVLSLPITRVVVAHRLSTVARADRILVLSQGRIVESGPPAHLREQDGPFARLVARQEL